MTLREELTSLLNRHSAENESDTPDYILAAFLMSSLDAFDAAVRSRDAYWKIDPWNEKSRTKPRINEPKVEVGDIFTDVAEWGDKLVGFVKSLKDLTDAITPRPAPRQEPASQKPNPSRSET